jgi:hypothetical protein
MSRIPLSLFLLAAGSRLVLDDTIEIPRSEWRYVDIAAKEPMAVMNCEYQVVSENSPVRIVWIARRNLDTFRAGRRENILAATPFGMDGKLRHFATEPGDYAMVIENQPATRAGAKVKVKVWLESAVRPKVLSAQRRLAVILISAVVFFAIVSFSAFKLRGQRTKSGF